jgi:hypothetical protein
MTCSGSRAFQLVDNADLAILAAPDRLGGESVLGRERPDDGRPKPDAILLRRPREVHALPTRPAAESLSLMGRNQEPKRKAGSLPVDHELARRLAQAQKLVAHDLGAIGVNAARAPDGARHPASGRLGSRERERPRSSGNQLNGHLGFMGVEQRALPCGLREGIARLGQTGADGPALERTELPCRLLAQAGVLEVADSAHPGAADAAEAS